MTAITLSRGVMGCKSCRVKIGSPTWGAGLRLSPPENIHVLPVSANVVASNLDSYSAPASSRRISSMTASRAFPPLQRGGGHASQGERAGGVVRCASAGDRQSNMLSGPPTPPAFAVRQAHGPEQRRRASLTSAPSSKVWKGLGEGMRNVKYEMLNVQRSRCRGAEEDTPDSLRISNWVFRISH